MSKPHALTEYLYVDRRRLDAYFEQISPPVTYDKVPVWKVGLQLTGPSVDGTQNRLARSFTLHEKVSAFLHYLEENHLKYKRRPRLVHELFRSNVSFCYETIRARRVFVPPRKETDITFSGLKLWISDTSFHRLKARAGVGSIEVLFLIEDFGKDDYERPDVRSGYSALMMLAHELGDKGGALLLQPMDDRESPLELSHRISRRISRDPIEFLTALGGRILDDRRIQVVYRIRASCIDQDIPERPGVLVGYPIVIMVAE